jgi:hypothetical protein
VHDNGNANPPAENSGDDPADFFPHREVHLDCTGTPRSFVLDMFDRGHIFTVTAVEEGRGEEGYELRSFDGSSPWTALGKLRGLIRRRLATRYVREGESGPELTHDEIRGMISDGEDGPLFMIDGRRFDLEAFGRLVGIYSGFEFHLRILDEAEK